MTANMTDLRLGEHRLNTTIDARYRISFNPILPISGGGFGWHEYATHALAKEAAGQAHEQALHLAQKGNLLQRILATAFLSHPVALHLYAVEIFFEEPINAWFRVR